MNKLILIIGIVVLGVGGIFFFQSRKNSGLPLVPSLKKEISVGTDVCREFPKEWVSEAMGKTVVREKQFDMTGTHVCTYFVSENSFVAIHFEDLSVETNKKGQGEMDRIIKTDSRIPMEHYVVWQENGLINGIYLVLGPNKFVSLDKIVKDVPISDEEFIAFAVNVVRRLQSGENVVTSEVTPQEKVDRPLDESGTNHKSIAESFYKALAERKIVEAIAMMTKSCVPNDETKQAWGVQFNAFKKLTVKSIEPAMQEEWTDSKETYLVTMDVEMTPESENGPVPFYGYENGTNSRWITLENENGTWKVADIATGP